MMARRGDVSDGSRGHRGRHSMSLALAEAGQGPPAAFERSEDRGAGERFAEPSEEDPTCFRTLPRQDRSASDGAAYDPFAIENARNRS